MTTQQIFYEQAVPVTPSRHATWAVEATRRFDFARPATSVPLTAVEFPSAAAEYAIVFAGTATATMPGVVLGLREGDNLYVAEDGSWKARYIPAFVRRYPFVFSAGDDGRRFTLCIDESFAGLDRDGHGQRLFDDDGEQTEFLANVLRFLQDYQRHFQRTKAFCEKLRDLDLLEPMQAQFTSASGDRRAITGFRVVSRDKLRRLPGEALADLARTDELELVYLHLHSLSNLRTILERSGGGEPDADPGTRTVAEAAGASSAAAAAAPAAETARTEVDSEPSGLESGAPGEKD